MGAVRFFRGIIQSISDTGSGLRTAKALGRGLRTIEDVPVMGQRGLVAMPLSGDAAAFLQVDDLVVCIATDDSSGRPQAAAGETLLYAAKDTFIRVMPDGTVRIKAKQIVLGTDDTPAATCGVVNGQCLCAFTGLPHPDVSATVFASKEAT
jgi:phage gp45-like